MRTQVKPSLMDTWRAKGYLPEDHPVMSLDPDRFAHTVKLPGVHLVKLTRPDAERRDEEQSRVKESERLKDRRRVLRE